MVSLIYKASLPHTLNRWRCAYVCVGVCVCLPDWIMIYGDYFLEASLSERRAEEDFILLCVKVAIKRDLYYCHGHRQEGGTIKGGHKCERIVVSEGNNSFCCCFAFGDRQICSRWTGTPYWSIKRVHSWRVMDVIRLPTYSPLFGRKSRKTNGEIKYLRFEMISIHIKLIYHDAHTNVYTYIYFFPIQPSFQFTTAAFPLLSNIYEDGWTKWKLI